MTRTTFFLPDSYTKVKAESVETIEEVESDQCCEAFGNGIDSLRDACVSKTIPLKSEFIWDG